MIILYVEYVVYIFSVGCIVSKAELPQVESKMKG